jgi:hypothetical protein
MGIGGLWVLTVLGMLFAINGCLRRERKPHKDMGTEITMLMKDGLEIEKEED